MSLRGRIRKFRFGAGRGQKPHFVKVEGAYVVASPARLSADGRRAVIAGAGFSSELCFLHRLCGDAD